MEDNVKGHMPDLIQFDCPAVKRLWEHTDAPAGEDPVNQFLCRVV